MPFSNGLFLQQLDIISLNSASDTSELLGGFEQVGHFERLSKIVVSAKAVLEDQMDWAVTSEQALLSDLVNTKLKFQSLAENEKEIKEFLEKLLDFATENSAPGRDEIKSLQTQLDKERSAIKSNGFDWMESLLVKAMKAGTWVLFDNANYCNPSVLDRLNGVLEANGVLDVGEQGGTAEAIIRPHPGTTTDHPLQKLDNFNNATLPCRLQTVFDNESLPWRTIPSNA